MLMKPMRETLEYYRRSRLPPRLWMAEPLYQVAF
jgi:hypothetical protein